VRDAQAVADIAAARAHELEMAWLRIEELRLQLEELRLQLDASCAVRTERVFEACQAK